MEQFFYTETMTVMNADADFRSLLKPSALLRYVEQVSADHARAFGMDDKFFQDHNVAFLVGKQALQFVRVPRRTEALTLITRAEHSRRGAIKRHHYGHGCRREAGGHGGLPLDPGGPDRRPHHAGTGLDRGKFLE